jgi:hypothetical protein
MLRLFNRRPKPPRPEVHQQVEHWLCQFRDQFTQVMSLMDEPQFKEPPDSVLNLYWLDEKARTKDLINQNVLLGKSRTHLEAARAYLVKAQQVWPDGEAIFHELLAALDKGMRIIQNSEAMNHIWLRADVQDPERRIRPFILENRRLALSADNYLLKGLSQIREVLGLDLLRDVLGLDL